MQLCYSNDSKVFSVFFSGVVSTMVFLFVCVCLSSCVFMVDGSASVMRWKTVWNVDQKGKS